MHRPGSDPPQQPTPAETDPRFPSGKWTGFWLQRGIAGRQHMSLDLAFAGGQVRGSGWDRVGRFTMTGSYDLVSGACKIVKAYPGSHAVDYDGTNDGEGLWIWGLWQIPNFDRGGFHLWPAGEEDPTVGRRLGASRERPQPRRQVRLVPDELQPAGS